MPLNVKSPHEYRLQTLADACKEDEGLSTLVKACTEKYVCFRDEFLNAFSHSDFSKMATLLDDYRAYAKALERKGGVMNERSKYYSSIMEEVPVLLCRKRVETLISSLNLDSHLLVMGGAECVIRIAANPDGTYFYETKRIDFCLAMDTAKNGKWIPLLGLEVKKYCDKTMFGTILETYKSLQIFRPRTYYGFLVEDEARSPEVVLNSPIFQKEFILCDGKRNRSELNSISVPNLERFSVELLKAAEDALNVLAKATAETANQQAEKKAPKKKKSQSKS